MLTQHIKIKSSGNYLFIFKLSVLDAVIQSILINNRKCLFTIGGGTGFIGSALVNQLRFTKFKPVVISRKQNFPTTLTWDEIKRNGLPSDCHGIVNLAGATIGDVKKRWTEKYKQEVCQSRIETTSLLAQLLKNEQKNPKVFITASGIGYYPPGTSEIFTENSEVKCSNDYFSKLCQQWEIAGDLGEKTIHRRVIVRIGLVLGRNGGAIRQMYLPFWLGFGGHMASGEQPFPWIHIDDLVGIFVHALTNSNVRGILNAVAPSMITNAEFTKAFGSALHRPTLFSVPEFALNFAFGKERAEMLIQGQKVKPQRTLESGYKFKYTNIYDAMKQIILVLLEDVKNNAPLDQPVFQLPGLVIEWLHVSVRDLARFQLGNMPVKQRILRIPSITSDKQTVASASTSL
ncbi:Epimerase family protein SDR39U1 [Trichinella spiralis]|uniref:Epimerase family protein SDR39U1 n=1 Tax=Trichinella spiralis TaxID=6334 RepID=A0A0V1BR49_TRISP|nr:Epimerase family protein SDR39U1 [Trichinella spiralis]